MATAKPMQTQEREQDQGGERQRQSAQPSQQRQPSRAQNGRTKRGYQRAKDEGPRSRLRGLDDEKLARGMGWFSIGLGLAEVLAPKKVAQMIGARDRYSGVIRAYGLREITSGIGILTQRRPAGWVWSRVAGDALDLATLGAAFASPKAKPGKLIAATAAVAGVTALDVICAQQLSSRPGMAMKSGVMQVRKSIAINRPPEELYRFWRDFQNLPRFMKHLESVQVIDARRSHWVAKGPAGTKVEWDAEITDERTNEMIAWRSLEGAEVDNSGVVWFESAPGKRGTLVKVDLQYSPPAGVIGASVAKLFGEEPGWQMQDDLRHFKQVMEIGEVITTEGQPAGRTSSTSWRYDSAVRS
jgi:uncharacterized membrane protein